MNLRNEKDNLSIVSVNTVTSAKQQRIFEGFLLEDSLKNVSGNKKCNNQSINLFGQCISDQLLNNQKVCASWNSKNNFIHITSTPNPFRIYFDDIIAVRKVESGNTIFFIILKKHR